MTPSPKITVTGDGGGGEGGGKGGGDGGGGEGGGDGGGGEVGGAEGGGLTGYPSRRQAYQLIISFDSTGVTVSCLHRQPEFAEIIPGELHGMAPPLAK